MIYLDSSVAHSHILTEERRPSTEFWQQPFTASRLLQYEVWNRLHARRASGYRQSRAREVLRRVNYLEMTDVTIGRALLPFPIPVRTLDGLHLAAMTYLRDRGASITLASYDVRLLAVAHAMNFPIVQP